MSSILTYALREYGVSRQELKMFHQRISLEAEQLRRTGSLIALPRDKEEALKKIGRKPARVRSGASVFKERRVADSNK